MLSTIVAYVGIVAFASFMVGLAVWGLHDVRAHEAKISSKKDQ